MPDKPEKMGKPVLDREYILQILAPPNVPAHRVMFEPDSFPLSGRHITEHIDQPMRALKRNDVSISWEAMGGSRGDELFRYEMKLFHGGVMLGTARRIDAGGGQPESPVMCRSLNPGDAGKR